MSVGGFIQANAFLRSDTIFGLYPTNIPNPTQQDGYVIVNGTLTLAERCGKVNPTDCNVEGSVSGSLRGDHRDWTIVDVALQSVGILINQGFRFSADAQLARAVAQLTSVGSAWDARLQRIRRIAEAIQRTQPN